LRRKRPDCKSRPVTQPRVQRSPLVPASACEDLWEPTNTSAGGTRSRAKAGLSRLALLEISLSLACSATKAGGQLRALTWPQKRLSGWQAIRRIICTVVGQAGTPAGRVPLRNSAMRCWQGSDDSTAEMQPEAGTYQTRLFTKQFDRTSRIRTSNAFAVSGWRGERLGRRSGS
jgi:hypothetical protein